MVGRQRSAGRRREIHSWLGYKNCNPLFEFGLAPRKFCLTRLTKCDTLFLRFVDRGPSVFRDSFSCGPYASAEDDLEEYFCWESGV